MSRRSRPIVRTTLAALLLSAPAWAAAPTTAPVKAPPKPSAKADPLPLNTAVLKYAASQVGKTVGNGECWTLAAEALKAADAQHANGYTYGHKLAAGEAVKPGDVMQFTSCVFKGGDSHHWWSMTLGFPNHTGVVKAVLNAKKFQIYQQHPGPVNVATINFNDLKSGTWEVYRPVPPKGG